MEYSDTNDDLAEIANELDVGAILTGSAQRAGGTLRINVELVDPHSAESLWAESYDREWTVDGQLEIQADIAERVARSLEVTLSQAERQSLATALTRDPEAYDYYIEAIESFDKGFEAASSLVAVERAQRAVELDPDFAAAWAMLGHAHLYLYWDGHDRTPERRALAEEALDRALEIAPDLPDVRAAVGRMHYWGYLDYERALEVLLPLEREAPSTRYVLDGIAAIKRRQGNMEEAVDYFLRAYELDPLHATWGSEAGLTYYLLRRYDEALPLIETTVVRDPGGGFAYGAMARTLIARDGDVAAAREYLDRGVALRAVSPFLDYEAVLAEVFDRRYEAALARLDAVGGEAIGELQFRWYPTDLMRGRILAFQGDTAGSREAYEAAIEVLEAERERLPDDERIAGALGLAYAGLGLEEKALAEVDRGVGLMPVEREYWRGIHRLEERARVLVRAGRTDEAIDEIETLLAQPGELSPAVLNLDPEWDTLREHPRFQALVAD
jgi:serine/threonine-protein kinase